MRAVCEKCGAAQPPDWKAGDLCTVCGAPVRRDVRCFWCAKWTPFAKFCRSCGAETVEETLYGAARMLKDAGTDRFTVPKRLRELDRDQIEDFTRIYQRHAVAVARHVDEVRFLERFLFQKSFSIALEEELVPQLPWPEEALQSLSGRPLPPGNDRAAVKAIGDSTPFAVTKSLAALARIRLSDWDAYREAAYALRSSDPALRAEAALELSSWRVRSSIGRVRDLEDDLAEELERSPFKLAAAVRLAFLRRRNDDLLREALLSKDPEISFPAALALGEVDRLQAALQGDDLQKAVAGNKLIELGILKPVEEVIEQSPLEVQLELVESLIRRKEPAPEAGQTLLEIVETTEGATLRERAARVLCRKLRPEWAMRIARAAKQERAIFQSLLSEGAELPPETAAEVASFMIDQGLFTMSQYGLKEAGERGAITDTFVPAHFAGAGEETRSELLRFAEEQLAARGDESLHRFVINVVFGPYPARTRSAAWWVVHRGCRRDEVRGEGPFKLERAAIERFFGSVREFLPKLSLVLRDEATMKEVGIYEFLAHLFSSAEASSLPDFFAEEAAAHDLVRAIIEALRGDYWAYLIDAMIQFLGLVGAHPRWRDEVITGLEGLEKKGNHHWEKSLRRLRLSVHGLPDESDWPALPDDFVPSRFDAANEEGRRELLRVAEQQLIHRSPEPVARFLLAVALGAYDTATRIEARRLFDERAPREIQRMAVAPASLSAPVENPWVAKQQEAERLGRELQEAALKISFGPGSPEEKTRTMRQLQAEFQAKIKALYGTC